MDADVIVVGAGPAGASAAFYLGRQGLRVLVVEKEKLPRYKTCAGGVPGTVLQSFPFALGHVLEQEVHKATFVLQSRQVTQPVPPGSMYMVMRDKFDHALLMQSQAEVWEGRTVVQVQNHRDYVQVDLDGGRILKAGFVLGADGTNSRVAKGLGLRRKRPSGIALEAEFVPDVELMSSFNSRLLVNFGKLEKGYSWIFPKKEHLSVGLGSLLSKKQGLGGILLAEMAKYGIYLQQTQIRARPLPLPVPGEKLHQGRTLLLGDAAGLVDPLTGEGIRHAVQSAGIASELILSEHWEYYSRRVQKEISNDLFWAARLSRIFYRWQGFGFEHLVRNSLLFQDMMRIVNGQLSYKQGMCRLPLYLWSRNQKAALDL